MLLTEQLTAKEREELDELLTGPDRRGRAALVRGLGGDVMESSD